MSNETNRPMKDFRCGSVCAAVWENTITVKGKSKTVPNVTFQRSYQDRQSGEWKNTSSFSVSSLPNLLVVALQSILYCASWDREDEDLPI